MILPSVVVEVGFTGPGTGGYLHLDDEVRGLLDTAELAPVDLWTDVTDHVASFSTRRGATRAAGPNVRYEAGTATIVLRNEDRRFDPTNLDGPYVAGGVTQVEPMRAVRIRAGWDGTTWSVFRGFADAWEISYSGPNASEVVLTATDAFKVFASYDRDESVAAGAGEDSGARIDRVLDSISWPDTDRVIATGDSTVQATTLADNVLTELLLTTDSELGEFYMDPEGRAVFRNRHALVEESRSNTSQATFGDEDPELRYADVGIEYDSDSIYNLLSIAREGGTAQVVEDAASRTAYLTRTYQRHDLILETDAECADYADFLLHQSADPELRFAELTLRPRRDGDALFPQALGRKLGDRITVVRRPPGGGDPIERDCLIRGVEHVMARGRTVWETRFVLQSATRLSFFVLDSEALGVLDTNALSY